MKVAMVGPQALARGFGLLGIETFQADSPKEALAHVERLTERKDVGVVLISEEFYHPLHEKYFDMKITLERPILLEIPAVQEVGAAAEGIAQFVKKATGVTV